MLDPSQMRDALEGCEAAYFLIHSMGDHKDFAETDRRGAANFAAATENGLGRIVYLGGMDKEEGLSPHPASRSFHHPIFGRIAPRIVEEAERSASGDSSPAVPPDA